jgi:AraC-like DNA-binding protein
MTRSRRSAVHIRESRVDSFVAVFPLATPLAIWQSGRTAAAGPGHFILLASDKPFDVQFVESAGYAYSQLMVRLPGPQLRSHIPHIDQCCALPVDVRHGAGRILRSLTEFLIEDRNDYSASQAERFGPILLGAFNNVAIEAFAPSERRGFSRESARLRIVERAKAFIESNLSNPELDPHLVADHCRISVRYLHATFAEQSLAVAAFIRKLRLKRCREDLLNPALADQTVIGIAMRWGFGSSSSFNRAYLDKFGISPRADRARSPLRNPPS